MGQCGSVGGVGLIVTRSRILGATGNRHRAQQGGERQNLGGERGRRNKPLPPRLDCVAPDSKKLSTQGTRPAVAMLMFPNSKRGSPAASLVQRSSQRELRAAIAPGPLAKHAIMDGKFESHSNNYDESNLNRP